MPQAPSRDKNDRRKSLGAKFEEVAVSGGRRMVVIRQPDQLPKKFREAFPEVEKLQQT